MRPHTQESTESPGSRQDDQEEAPSAGEKRSAEHTESPGADDEGSGKKKKKTGQGNRGVANLTPEQLAKKRANDREAQRAIRERTKNQIETLERRIQELTNQEPYQELQAVVQAKELVEQENREIRQHLSSIVSVLQLLIGGADASALSGRGHIAGLPSSSSSHIQAMASSLPHTVSPGRAILPPPDVLGGAQSTSTPGSTTSSAATNHADQGGGGSSSDRHHQRWKRWPKTICVSESELTRSRSQLENPKFELCHSLDMGPERLGLGFLLDSGSQANEVQAGAHGAQDTPHYHHVPMKHDWTAVSNDQAFRKRPYIDLWSPGMAIEDRSDKRRDHIHDADPTDSFPYTQPLSQRPHAGASYENRHSAVAGPLAPMVPYYAMTPKICEATCPLDSLLLDFLAERRQRAAEGLPVAEVVGPRYPSVSSLLNPANSKYSHPLSKVFTDILSTFPDLSSLPERVAVLYIMFLVMRWLVSPTKENYNRLPEWMRPLPSQLRSAHPLWQVNLPFPIMRDKLVALRDQPGYIFDNFFIPYTATLTINWPYHDTDVLLRIPDDKGELLINPVFERHIRDQSNWALGDAFGDAFPALVPTAKFYGKYAKPQPH